MPPGAAFPRRRCYDNGKTVLPGRKNISKKNLTEVPLVMVCYDLLEWNTQARLNE